MTITTQTDDRNLEKESTFQLTAFRINQAALTEAVSKNNLSEADAKTSALKALGLTSAPPSNSPQSDALTYLTDLLKDHNSNKKSKFVNFLKFAGKIAGSVFGIAVPL